MRPLKGVWMGGLLVTASLVLPRLAWAQCSDTAPCIFPPVLSERTGAGGASDQDARPPQFTPNGISYSDCVSNVSLSFSLQISNPSSSDELQVWAGPYSGSSGSGSANGPCVFANSRQSECWHVVDGQVTPEQPTTSVTVSAQELALYLGQTSSPTYVAATSAACGSQTTPGPVDLGIYFMFIAADGSVDGQAGVYQLPVGTLGPFAPADVTLTISDGSGTVGWIAPDDPTIAGYYVYCQDDGDAGAATGTCGGAIFESSYNGGFAIAPPVAVDAGAEATTGDDAATEDEDADAEFVIEAAVSVPATPAGISEIPAAFQCGLPLQGNTSTSETLTLKNFDHYVVGVAAVDQLGNVGPVGNLVCGTPAPIASFWYDYVNDGGRAGGGYCALEGVGMRAGGSCMAIGIGLASIGLVRRRRKARAAQR